MTPTPPAHVHAHAPDAEAAAAAAAPEFSADADPAAAPGFTPERILLIGYAQLRRYGQTRVSWFRKLERGLVREGHHVLFFSDRDVAAVEAPFGWRDLGRGKANRRLIETAAAYAPTLILIGHADIITDQTLEKLKRVHDVPLAHLNNDPLFVPENVSRIRRRLGVCDRAFVSTGPRTLGEFFPEAAGRVHHMPNPVDPAVERFDASATPAAGLRRDLVFCGNATKHTRRHELLSGLKADLPADVRFDTFGLFGTPPVWGTAYDDVLRTSAMGLNLNRAEGHHWYSSARMAQLAGNGVLVITHAGNGFDTLLPPGTAVYYETADELKDQVVHFSRHDDERRERAARLRAFFRAEINNRRYARHIVETALGRPWSRAYVWADPPDAGV